MQNEIIRIIILTVRFRLIERGAITVLVITVSLWLLRKYVREVTKIRVKDEERSLPSISVTIGTPILIATLFIGYTYIDLSNPIEIGTQPRPHSSKDDEKTDGAVADSLNLRGLSEADQSNLHGRERSGRGELAFEADIEGGLRRIFVSLSNMPKALNPVVNARLLNLAIGVVCLRSENPDFARDFDRFSAGKDFEQVDAAIVDAMKAKTFANAFCQQIKLEFASE